MMVDYRPTTNRVAVTKPVDLRSVNGPAFTIIQGHQLPGTTNGDGAIRCVYLTNGATLSGFTLKGGATRDRNYVDCKGGGASCESDAAVLSNCVFTGNSAVYGGGIEKGTLFDCVLTGNSAFGDLYSAGGGAYYSTLNRCRLLGNSASYEGQGKRI